MAEIKRRDLNLPYKNQQSPVANGRVRAGRSSVERFTTGSAGKICRQNFEPSRGEWQVLQGLFLEAFPGIDHNDDDGDDDGDGDGDALVSLSFFP